LERDKWTRRQFLVATGAVGWAAIHLAGLSKFQRLSCYSEKVCAKNPIAYWRLGESEGPVVFDAIQNGHNGIFYGNPIYQEAGAVSNDTDTAIKLDGNHSYIEVPDNPYFSQPTSGQGLTVEVWMRPDSLIFTGEAAGYVHWLGKGEAGRHEWSLRFYSEQSSRPSRISAYIWSPEGGLGAGAYFQDKLVPGVWIHVVACYDSGDHTNPEAGVSIYKNGVLRGGPTTSPGALYKTYTIKPAHGTAPLRFGTRDQASFFEGGLDEVAIYPRVLTAAEIMDNYQTATTSCPEPSPQPTNTEVATETSVAPSTPMPTDTPTPNPPITETPQVPATAPPTTPAQTTPQPQYRWLLPLIQR
jgi:hypothetical protein